MPSAETLLSSVFGFGEFRPGQQEIVSAVAAGENVLAIMPTGGGKSLCFQLPALMREGVTVVISPLIALMRDQVRALREAGVAAGALNSGNTDEETDAIYAALDAGELKLLYMAPERLASGGTLNLLRRINTSMIAVDEAHCVSQWGHDFRPDYLRIGALREALDVPLAAFTATADEETRAEIITRLFGRQILEFAAARQGQSGIVYCGTRAKTETLSQALREAGHSSAAYHAGLDPEVRRDVERRFQQEDGLIVVATVAFGMGIDKPDIRWVAHADLPKTVEGYYQEIGRAGRDGAPAQTLTLFGPDDIRFRRSQIDESPAPYEKRAADHVRLNALLGLAESQTCRRIALLGYFGETGTKACGNCDLCDTPAKLFDGTEAVRKALSAILRTDETFGAGHLIDILMGTETDKVRQRGHADLPTFGVGKEYDRRQWNAIFRQMMGQDLIRPNPERHGALFMTDPARPILRGEAEVVLREDTFKKAGKSSSTRVKALVSEEDAPLLSALKAKRRALAEAAKVPAYIIFNDKTLIDMAEKRPGNLDAMAGITGVGATKLERYGAMFLEVITGDAPAQVHPKRRALATRGDAGAIFDLLFETQAALARGECGTQKPLSCSTTHLTKIVSQKPRDLAALERILGDKRVERFGDAFLEILHAD
jgi:ATP-dependent DNA helicase RecQ